MKRIHWIIGIAAALLIFTIIVFGLHLYIFHDSYFLSKYVLFYLGLIPLEVVLVTLIIDQLLEIREKREKLEKLNMVIGAFYSVVGTNLLVYFSDYDPNLDKIKNELIIKNEWTEEEFNRVKKKLNKYDYNVDIKNIDIERVNETLLQNRDFLLRLLENPVLLEHETFTELLRSVFHLSEELQSRTSLKGLPDTDYIHLAGDIKRAYTLLVKEWLNYMMHMKNNYPYLFSLAMRTNPFDQSASPIVK
ncbi:hypothetical protein CUJ83_12590 [Methanocella sp. CWC-04]|uniref:Uncharacterized protein n=1 Tax=Methanooceanicella nereidis TaxID=2052831 RepID=A0AAP2RED7_9EURY|nr:hypothetical protein [Methanocella sp. CWC-04]MCD1295833.1 hypothetical protein [Methanocella sp. CWC-04]